jgi:hypothetical protein
LIPPTTNSVVSDPNSRGIALALSDRPDVIKAIQHCRQKPRCLTGRVLAKEMIEQIQRAFAKGHPTAMSGVCRVAPCSV